MPNMLLKKSKHAFVLVPLDKERFPSATNPFRMEYPRGRTTENLPTPTLRRDTQIQILAVQKISLVKTADFLEDLPPDHQTSTRNRIDLHGLF
jgi:hypothetical protein